MALVERLVPVHGNTLHPHRLEHGVEGLVRALEDRRVDHVELAASEVFSSLTGLGKTPVRQGNIHPAGKTVLQVPLGLPVTQENEGGHLYLSGEM